MAGRIRSIKPETLEDERPAHLSDSAWRLWVSMWLLADDHGNCRASTGYLAAQIWWGHSKKPDVTKLLHELVAADSIVVYRVREQEYAHVNRWERHQRIDKPAKPKIPAPEEAESQDFLGGNSISPEKIRSDLDLEGKGEGREKEKDMPAAAAAATKFDFASVYAVYPRKEGKTKGIASLRSQVTTPEAFDELKRAVNHFAAKVKAEGTETGFVPHFSTWANERWRDYIDDPHITTRQNGASRTHENFRPPMEPRETTEDVTSKL